MHLVLLCCTLSHYLLYTYVYVIFLLQKKCLQKNLSFSFAQIPVPESVTKRWCHSMTSFTVSVNCVWLLITGGFTTKGDDIVTSPNTVMIVELGN